MNAFVAINGIIFFSSKLMDYGEKNAKESFSWEKLQRASN